MSKTTMIIFIVFCLVFSYTLFSAIKTSATFEPDFSIFYNASQDVMRHINPYIDHKLFTQFNYPLATTILFMPLSMLPFKTAQGIYTALSILSIGFIISSSLILCRKRISIRSFLIAAIFVLLSFPTKFTLGMGQTNLLAYCLLLLGFSIQNKYIKTSILLIVLAVLLKPLLGITLVIFLFEKQWKYFFVLLGGVAFFIISVPILFNQPFANEVFLQNILHQSLVGREVYYNQGLLGFISRLTIDSSLRSILNSISTFILLSIVLFTFIKQKVNFTQKLSLLLTILVIIDPLSWQHHFVFLIFPFITLTFVLQKTKSPMFFYLFLILSYILVSNNIKTPQAFVTFPQSLYLSHGFFGVVILFILEIIIFTSNLATLKKK